MKADKAIRIMQRHPEKSVLAGFVFLFIALFSVFPIGGTLPCNVDIWMFISIANSYPNLMESLVGNAPYTTAMYPIDNIYAYGETFPFTAAMFLFFKLLGMGDVWAFYLFMVTVFALNGWAVQHLAFGLTKNRPAAIFSGFAFAVSNFMFANLDNVYLLFYFIPVLAVALLYKALGEKKPRLLLAAGVLGGLQIYFAIYVFVYQSLFLAIVGLSRIGVLASRRFLPFSLGGAMSYLLVSLPLLAFHFHARQAVDLPPNLNLIGSLETFSLNLKETLCVLPTNILYPQLCRAEDYISHLMYLKQCAFIGFGVILLACYGLRRFSRVKLELLLVAVVGLMLALGPMIHVGEHRFASPLLIFYERLPLIGFLRFGFRAYFLTALAIALLAGFGLARLLKISASRLGRWTLLPVILLALLHFVENVPSPFGSFEARKYESPEAGVLQYFKDKNERVILDLPSLVYDDPRAWAHSERSLFPGARELIYRNWQAVHRQNILGGSAGYVPESHKKNKRIFNRLPEASALAKLADQGLTEIVYHKTMVLEDDRLEDKQLIGAACLKQTYKDDEVLIMTVNHDCLKRIEGSLSKPPIFIPQKSHPR